MRFGLQARCGVESCPFTRDYLYAAIIADAVERMPPNMMTVAAIIAGLLPICGARLTGAEVMQRVAVPMIGGMVSSTLLTLIVIPSEPFLFIHQDRSSGQWAIHSEDGARFAGSSTGASARSAINCGKTNTRTRRQS